MGEKKNPYRWNIQFNPAVASNREAIQILNALPPRQNAQVIAEALILYNRTYGLIDTPSNVPPLSIVPNQPAISQEPALSTDSKPVMDIQENPPEVLPGISSDAIPKEEASFADEYNATDVDLDDEYDDETENEEDGDWDDIFANSLSDMGITDD